MSKRITKAKLHLSRETLRGLAPAELDQINGGVKDTGCLSQCTQCPTGGTRITRPQQPGGGNDNPLGGGRPGRPF
jgi:hypothetical protein